MTASGYCENCGYGYLGDPGAHRPTCPLFHYDGPPHQWADLFGRPWRLGLKSDLCAVCGGTPDEHLAPPPAGDAPEDC